VIKPKPEKAVANALRSPQLFRVLSPTLLGHKTQKRKAALCAASLFWVLIQVATAIETGCRLQWVGYIVL
jgi:hypothetical protein